jgi:hypothetical protein
MSGGLLMMKGIACVLVFCFAFPAYGQDSSKTVTFGWKHSLVAGLNLTQVAFSDWSQGGDNALAYAATLQGKSVEEEMHTNWTTDYKFGFGQARLGSQGLRKTDDVIDLSTVLTYKAGVLVNPYASATLKSQFARGYKYDANGNATAVSAFFDPGYLTQSAGVGYQPIPEVKERVGVALREIFTSEFPSYADDSATTEVEKTSVLGGIESVTEIEWHLEQSLLFTSKLELFSAFKTPYQIVVRNDNTLAAKVNQYVSVMLNLQLINETKISPRTQVKETIAIGISYVLL